MKLEPIYNRCTTVSTAMKVCHLKAILEDLPDDMPVVIPARVDENYNILTNCVAVGTAGVLSSPYEATRVLGCLTPEEVAKRFVYCYKYNTDIYHEEKELSAKEYYEGLIERWRERIDKINAHADPESQSRAEWDVLEEVIFEVSLGFPLLKR